MAAVVVASLAVIGGVAAMTAFGALDQPTTLDDGVVAAGGNSFPGGSGDLDSDEYLVDDDFESGEDTDGDREFQSIGSAIDDADDGYTIYVRDGEYDESVLVDTEVDLIAEPEQDVVINANSVAMNITADNVLVQGFTLVGDTTSGDNVVEVQPTSPSNDVKNLEFTMNEVIVGEDAVGLYHAPMDQDVPSHDETLIHDNTFTVHEGSVSSPVEAEGLVEVEQGAERPHNITIDDNVFTSPTDQGENLGEVTSASVLLEANDSAVTNNDFDTRADTDSSVIQVLVTGDRNTVANNWIDSNWAAAGIAVDTDPGQDSVVEGNKVKNAQLIGILVAEHTGVVVHDNHVKDTNGPGIAATEADGAQISANKVKDNEDVGILVLESDGALVDGNDVVDTRSIGIWVADSIGVDVEYNLLDNNSIGAQVDGQAELLGSTATANNDSYDVLFENNKFVDNEDVGLWVANFDTGVAPEDRPQANYNDFAEQGHDVQNNAGERIDARLNWFGVDDPSITDEASVAGDVLYDPFLTDVPGNVDQKPDETEQYAHDFTLDASESTMHVIASPGPGDRTVGEAFSDLPAGSNLFAYDNANGQWVQPAASDDIESLDAFVVTGLSEDATVVFGFAGNGAASPQNADLSEGWNLVGAPRKDGVDPAFDQFAGTITSIAHHIEAAKGMPAFMNLQDASGDERAWQATFGQGDDKCVSPYTGYWVFVDDDDPGGLPANLIDGVSYTDAIDLLRTDSSSYPCGYGGGT